jgi:hypothetical protein
VEEPFFDFAPTTTTTTTVLARELCCPSNYKGAGGNWWVCCCPSRSLLELLHLMQADNNPFLLFTAQYTIHKPLHIGETKRCVLACLQDKYFVYMQK